VLDESCASVERLAYVVGQWSLGSWDEADDPVRFDVCACGGVGESVVQDCGNVVRVVEAACGGEPGQESFDVMSVCFGAT
jgi:hypothetical protein